jgi:hypothetical protein
MIRPIHADDVRAYLQQISPCEPWKDWFLIASDSYLIRRNRVKSGLREGVIHTPDCRNAQNTADTSRFHWEEVNNGELIYYWWAMAIEENPNKQGKSPPELTHFMKFCSICTAIRPNYQKAREIYERAHPRPD